jgi:RHS repeat-associated protein
VHVRGRPGTETYTYDGNGVLLKRARYAAGSSTPISWTRYVGGLYELHSDGTYTKYYQGLGRTVAIRTGTGGGTVYYPLLDHLGSTVGLLDGSGNVVSGSKTWYWPYGAQRVPPGQNPPTQTQTDRLYTGQRAEPGDSALGLYNYKARFYSTMLGRFVSVDPVGGTVGDPQSWDGYAYTRNNPLRFTDPTGRVTCAPAMPGLGSGAGDPGGCNGGECDLACAHGAEAMCAVNPTAPGCSGPPPPTPPSGCGQECARHVEEMCAVNPTLQGCGYSGPPPTRSDQQECAIHPDECPNGGNGQVPGDDPSCRLPGQLGACSGAVLPPTPGPARTCAPTGCEGAFPDVNPWDIANLLDDGKSIGGALCDITHTCNIPDFTPDVPLVPVPDPWHGCPPPRKRCNG